MSIVHFIAVCALLVVAAQADSACRFAQQYTTEQILTDPAARQSFLLQHAAMEARFMKGIGIDRSTNMTLDGQRLAYETGLPLGPPHEFSAPSKEAMHVAVLARVLDGSSAIANATYTVEEALDVLESKVTSYEAFGRQYPGFGGFFPWMAFNLSGGMSPTWDWQNRVPSLDNGELFWAAFGASSVLNRSVYRAARPGLADRWANVWRQMVANVKTVFYAGNGNFRTVTSLTNQSLPVAQNNYTGEDSFLDDPYEGELITVMVYLFDSGLNASEKQQMWVNKRPMLQAVNLTVTAFNDSTGDVELANITVEKGFWYSSHEKFKYFGLPYRLSPTNNRVFLNGERARTWFSFAGSRDPTLNATGYPGLFASVNGPVANDSVQFPYYSACGIQPIAFEEVDFDDTITPYGAMALHLAAPGFGAAWLHHMLLSPKGQNCWGTTEAFSTDGTMVAPLTTWDSKISSLVGIIGGLADVNAAALDEMGLLDSFIQIIESEWSRVFPAGTLAGENLPFMPPRFAVPSMLDDFTTCSATSPPCPN